MHNNSALEIITNGLAVFDVDHTLTKGNIFERLTTSLGWNWDDHKKLYESKLRGELSYEEVHGTVVQKYRQSPHAHQQRIIQILQEVTLQPHALQLFKFLRKHKCRTVLLSGGFDPHVKAVAKTLSAHTYAAARSIVYNREGKFDDFHGPANDRAWKAEEFIKVCKTFGKNPKNVVVIGDGENDLEVFKLSSYSIAVHCTHEELKNHAWKVAENLGQISSFFVS